MQQVIEVISHKKKNLTIEIPQEFADEIPSERKFEAFKRETKNFKFNRFEFSYTMRCKFKRTSLEIEASLAEIHKNCGIAIISYSTICNALKIANKYKYSFPDSLIIATGIEYNCNIIYSEDMHNDHVIENNLKILNPFVSL